MAMLGESSGDGEDAKDCGNCKNEGARPVSGDGVRKSAFGSHLADGRNMIENEP